MIIGDVIPDAVLTLPGGERGSLAKYRGRPLVAFFYPKDDTPGCTNEAKAFSALLPEFDAIDCAVVGVSRDTMASHAKYASKHALAVPLASDADGALTDALGVWVEKSMYGKTYWGIERSTMLIDASGRVVATWRKVKVAGHAEAVLTRANALVADGA